MEISTAPLRQALEQLETSLGLTQSKLADADPRLTQVFQTAAIKSFEYCYALAIKLIERRLKERLNPDAVAEFSFRSLIRAAQEADLVADLEQWDEFRELRNTTAHTYDQAKARKVMDTLPAFLTAVKRLLTRVEAQEHAS